MRRLSWIQPGTAACGHLLRTTLPRDLCRAPRSLAADDIPVDELTPDCSTKNNQHAYSMGIGGDETVYVAVCVLKGPRG